MGMTSFGQKPEQESVLFIKIYIDIYKRHFSEKKAFFLRILWNNFNKKFKTIKANKKMF